MMAHFKLAVVMALVCVVLAWVLQALELPGFGWLSAGLISCSQFFTYGLTLFAQCIGSNFQSDSSVLDSPPAQSRVEGVAFISITTDDVTDSLRFYTKVMGGMHVPELSFRFHGDDHYEVMFHRELEEARRKGLDPASLGVPDIRTAGAYEVRGEFVVFDNSLLQLMEFTLRGSSSAATSVFHAHMNLTSTAYITAPHLCFWVQEDVDFDHYVEEMESRAASLGFTKVKANRIVEVHSEAERLSAPKDSKSLKAPAGSGFEGLAFAYVRGPSEEHLEFLQVAKEFRENAGRDYCKHRSVSSAFVDNYSDNQFKKESGVPGQHNGIFHLGIRVDGLQKSQTFYSQVLGGQLLPPPMAWDGLKGNAGQHMLFQKEMLEAEAAGLDYHDVGIANTSDSGSESLSARLVLYDSVVVELMMWFTHLPTGEKVPFNPRYKNLPSPAFVNTELVAFSVNPDLHFPSLLKAIQRAAEENGLDEVKVQGTKPGGHQGQNQGYVIFSSGPLAGLSYTFLNGPAGEHVMLTQFGGSSRDKLKRALEQYGGVSTIFPDLNPWVSGSMTSYCQQFEGSDDSPSA